MQEDPSSNTSYTASGAPTSIPALGESFSSNQFPAESSTDQSEQTDTKSKKKFWQLGKKKDDKKDSSVTSAATSTSLSGPLESSGRSTSPQHQAMALPASPGRQPQSPPRVHSPAESQIFERNVQDESVAVVTSPAIPSHIATEDHIPPVLDASSMAITDDHLTPDNVEIVTHAAHLPVAASVSSSIHGESGLSSPVGEENPQSLETIDETAPTYAALDSADIRRLSFISFADVVHGEQTADGSMRDSFYLSGASSIASPGVGPRSPSPIRSSASPPLAAATNAGDVGMGLNLDGSPGRKVGPGSPKSLGASLAAISSPNVTGEITIETMRQALRKTESGDLGAATKSTLPPL
ncbi:MAG: hypothetical protein GOMPHAMPRED_004429 [Gomphillus americanus]|uniref:Uncharacterized protein n=1 Tax=Gomphillus americanus TaxID=1940652 RepID=A0A8H3FPE8_9LECA|nr:MAG: hypothetical protein GOMPHAMPRED_004429 [Gomphillus americanus]